MRLVTLFLILLPFLSRGQQFVSNVQEAQGIALYSDVVIYFENADVVMRTPTDCIIDKVISCKPHFKVGSEVTYKVVVKGGYYLFSYIDKEVTKVEWIPDFGLRIVYKKIKA